MKGILIKCNHFYALQIDSNVIAVSLDKETEEHTVNYKHSLSKQNCEAIERGYDLDELVKKEYQYDDDMTNECFIERKKQGFKEGFQTALEILGDKKFSSGQLLNAMDLVWQWMNGEDYGCKTLTEVQDKHIQSLQQTEWDVEVVMDRIPADLAPDGWDVFPKLDAENCLILKRVE
jgi:hypothetical protein